MYFAALPVGVHDDKLPEGPNHNITLIFPRDPLYRSDLNETGLQ